MYMQAQYARMHVLARQADTWSLHCDACTIAQVTNAPDKRLQSPRIKEIIS